MSTYGNQKLRAIQDQQYTLALLTLPRKPLENSFRNENVSCLLITFLCV